jgi:hypothetical protein
MLPALEANGADLYSGWIEIKEEQQKARPEPGFGVELASEV